MKKLTFILLLAPFFIWNCHNDVRGLKNGDLIFQTSRSSQSLPIQLATGSEWSHCGIIYIKNGRPYVFEASTKVKLSPLNRFIKKGENKKYRIKRLINRDSILTNSALKKMKTAGEKFKGLPYDPAFAWSNERIYCSELIWKIYRDALGLEIGKLQKLEDFNLGHPLVKDLIKKRYGNDIPLGETVISPVSMYNSMLLVDVQM